MSTFRVKLTNAAQGLMDSAGQNSGTSIQRTMYAMGPNKVSRKLADGEEFTDSNYWKRFAYPQMPLDEAFIEVVSDDGSVYSDVESENTFPYSYKDVTLTGGTSYADNVCDIFGDTGGYGQFAWITPTVACKMKINGLSTSVTDLAANVTVIFEKGDMLISKLEFDNSASGASSGTIDVLFGVKASSNS
jgi:hypothetical protein